MADPIATLLEQHRQKIAWVTFTTICVGVPAYLFANWDRFVKDKTPFEWRTASGIGWLYVVLAAVVWLFTAAIISVAVYALLGIIAKRVRNAPSEIKQEQAFAYNLIPLPVDDNLAVELDRREVFHRSQHDFALQAITAKFVNQSKSSGGIGTAKAVGARVLIYEADCLDLPLRTIDYVCWLDHEEPLIDFPCDAPQRIVLAVFEPKTTNGFEPRVTFYGNHTDHATPLDRYDYGKPYEHFHIEVVLNGSSYWYELNIQYGVSYSFESFIDRDKRLKLVPVSVSANAPDKLILIKTLGAFRDEGHDLLQRLSIHRVLVPYEQDFETWRKRVQDYLEQTSQGYAVRFRSKNIEYQCPLKASQRTRPLIDMVYTCVMRLEEFIRELSR